MSAESQEQVGKTADRLRDGFLITLRELDRRRHRAMDVRTLMQDNRRLLLAAGAGLTALVVVIVTTSVALARSRRSRMVERRMRAARRAWENPDRIASRAAVVPAAGILVTLLKVAALAAGAQLLRRTVQRALPSGK